MAVACSGQHRPALGNGIDPAFLASGGTEHGAVVEESAGTRVRPSRAVRYSGAIAGLFPAAFFKRRIPAPAGDFRELCQDVIEENPSQTLSPFP